MGVGLSQALINGRSSLIAQQARLNVIGNNLSNANRPEYHRQTANLETGIVIKTGDGFFGTGVLVKNITRSVDNALETSLRSANTDDGYNSVYSSYLGKVEDVITVDGASPIQTSMQDFADAWQSVAAASPEDLGRRTNLINQGTKLKSQFNQQYAYMKTLRDDLADPVTGVGQIEQRVTTFNGLVEQMLDLNNRIAEGEAQKYRPQQANDLRDERDSVVAQMSKLVPVTVTELDNRAYQVKIGNFTVVNGTRPDKEVIEPPTLIQMAMNGAGPDFSPQLVLWSYDRTLPARVAPPAPPPLAYNVSNTLHDAAAAPPVNNLPGGEIAGCVKAREYVVDQMNELWSFAQNIAYIVNTRHATGWDLSVPPAAGGNFFNVAVPGAMSVLISDPRKIAAATVAGESGNGLNAMQIWNDLNTPVTTLAADPLFPAIPDPTCVDPLINHADRLADTISSNVKLADELYATSTASVAMFTNSIQEVSGVSSDIELSTMLESQRVYQASAKYLTTVTSMMDAVIAMI